MSLLSPGHPIRCARPSRSLAAAHTFWCDGVGLEVLWRTDGHGEGEHALLMVGAAGAAWHLELVEDAAALEANPPGTEDLLVVYRGHPATHDDIARLTDCGGRRVTARNPYWEEHGVTIEDPDGYRLVLCHRTWD